MLGPGVRGALWVLTRGQHGHSHSVTCSWLLNKKTLNFFSAPSRICCPRDNSAADCPETSMLLFCACAVQFCVSSKQWNGDFSVLFWCLTGSHDINCCMWISDNRARETGRWPFILANAPWCCGQLPCWVVGTRWVHRCPWLLSHFLSWWWRGVPPWLPCAACWAERAQRGNGLGNYLCLPVTGVALLLISSWAGPSQRRGVTPIGLATGRATFKKSQMQKHNLGGNYTHAT